MVKYTTSKLSKLRIHVKKVLLDIKQVLLNIFVDRKARVLKNGFSLSRLTKLKVKRKSIIFLSVNALLILGVIICVLLYQSKAGFLQSQRMAERWAGESDQRYTQVTCFLNDSASPDLTAIYTFGRTVDEKLKAASLNATNQGHLWTYTYSAESSLTVTGSYGSATATALGVGGNFFLFHPMILRDGSYISDSDFMHDRVVLDEELAWRIFGSVDIAGLNLTINGVPYPIAGVITREKDKFSTKTYTGGPGIFMSYESLLALGDAPITCYEIVLPDPISKFGLGVIKDNFPLGAQTPIQDTSTEDVKGENVATQNTNGVVLENTGRFGIESIIKVLSNFSDRTIQNSGIAYPYWENAARLVENKLALLLLLGFAFSLFPIGCFIYLIVKEIKHVKHHFKKPDKDL